ncbi:MULTISPECIES: hypothetical protein [Burkholderia cepacia complex]|uniref:hypothetical protein n=1 Tax=Burkholderia cepacia complex TaxID=87882 RepID=UPI001CF2E80F|nr:MULTISPECIES: hypothetical protein [Burkholderia cepacia complex]MCA8083144.1 hypothetical protein [Burkholderia cenocepacia]
MIRKVIRIEMLFDRTVCSDAEGSGHQITGKSAPSLRSHHASIFARRIEAPGRNVGRRLAEQRTQRRRIRLQRGEHRAEHLNPIGETAPSGRRPRINQVWIV